MNSPTLSVREIQKEDIDLILTYWLKSDSAFLVGMGVDLDKLPDEKDFRIMLSQQLRQSYEEKQSYCIIWQFDGKPVGHSSIAYRIWIIYTVPNSQLVLYLNTFCRMDVIIIGAIAGFYYCQRPFTIEISGWLRILLYVMLLFALFSNSIFYNPLLEIMKKYFYIGLIGFAILNYNFNPNAKLQLRNNKFIHYLGKISYGIYMYGSIVMFILLKKVIIPFHLNNIYLFIFLMTVIPIIIAAISYEYFETFFLKFKRHFEIIKTVS